VLYNDRVYVYARTAVRLSSSTTADMYFMLYYTVLYAVCVYRFACANAGDSLLDANFEVATANNAIILLTKEEEWSKAMIQDNTNKQVYTQYYMYIMYTLYCYCFMCTLVHYSHYPHFAEC
jgi:hypothetical protein